MRVTRKPGCSGGIRRGQAGARAPVKHLICFISWTLNVRRRNEFCFK